MDPTYTPDQDAIPLPAHCRCRRCRYDLHGLPMAPFFGCSRDRALIQARVTCPECGERQTVVLRTAPAVVVAAGNPRLAHIGKLVMGPEGLVGPLVSLGATRVDHHVACVECGHDLHGLTKYSYAAPNPGGGADRFRLVACTVCGTLQSGLDPAPSGG